MVFTTVKEGGVATKGDLEIYHLYLNETGVMLVATRIVRIWLRCKCGVNYLVSQIVVRNGVSTMKGVAKSLTVHTITFQDGPRMLSPASDPQRYNSSVIRNSPFGTVGGYERSSKRVRKYEVHISGRVGL